ncbi:hypothetical protein N9N67_11915, partial [Bacteriovoracaceae bacterium]|nr:hypothetical protein [Bacteriovoracaceae bacterium]
SIILHLIYQKDLTIFRAKEGNNSKTASGANEDSTFSENHQVYFRAETLPSALVVETPIQLKQSANKRRVAKKNSIKKTKQKTQKVISPTNYKKSYVTKRKNSLKKKTAQKVSSNQVDIREKIRKVRQKINQISAKNVTNDHKKPQSFFSSEYIIPISLLASSICLIFFGVFFYRRKSKVSTEIDPIAQMKGAERATISKKTYENKTIASETKNDYGINPGFVFTEKGDLIHYNAAATELAQAIDVNIKKPSTKKMRNLYFRLMTNLREDRTTGQKVLKVNQDFYTYLSQYRNVLEKRVKVVELIPYFRGKDERFETFQDSPLISEFSSKLDNDSKIYSLDDFLSSNLMGIHMIFEMNRISLQYVGNEGKEIFVGFSKKDLETIFTSFMVSLAKVLGQREQTTEAVLSTDTLSDRLFFKVGLPKFRLDQNELEKAFLINESEYAGLYHFFNEISNRYAALGLQININYLYGEQSEFLGTELNLSFKTMKETSKQIKSSLKSGSSVKVMPSSASLH